MEAVLLRLRIGFQLGVIISGIFVICDISWNGKKIFAKAKRSDIGASSSIGDFAIVLISALSLAILGALYSHEILVPLLLDYLSEDASRKSELHGNCNLGLVSSVDFTLLIFSFQAPIIILLLLRYEIVSGDGIRKNRGVLWFLGMAFGAFLSPPDPLSMFLVAGPVLLMIELALIFNSLTRNR